MGQIDNIFINIKSTDADRVILCGEMQILNKKKVGTKAKFLKIV